MNYAFLYRLIPEEYEREVASLARYHMQDAANALQWHIYEGLRHHLSGEIRLINMLPIDSYPQYYKKAFIRDGTFETAPGQRHRNLGFCNVKFIRNYLMPGRAAAALLAWCEELPDNRTVLTYTLFPAFLSAIEQAKRKFPDLKACAVVADLPNMISLTKRRNALVSAFQSRTASDIYARLDCIDGFVLLTAQMADYMRITKPYCVMEGIATRPEEVPAVQCESSGRRKILYSGTLHERFGIMQLVRAFQMLPQPDVELVICGVGDSEEEIAKAAAQDTRIRYLGRRSRDEVLILQKQASILVNPRQNTEEFTKYSFPSKNLEYLSSGVPLVAYRLDGIPQEYDPYMIYVRDNSVETLAETLSEVCAWSEEERHAYGARAKEFVLTQKNSRKQTKKITELLQQINTSAERR